MELTKEILDAMAAVDVRHRQQAAASIGKTQC